MSFVDLLLHVEKDVAWMLHAACAGVDAAAFYPEPHDGGRTSRYSKRVCADCPVRAECLEYSITPPYETFGIWGGLTERERRRVIARRRRERRAA